MFQKSRSVRGKSLSTVIVLAMLFSMITIFSEEVKAEPLDLGEDCPIKLIDIRVPPYFRLAFTDNSNEISLTLRNDDNATREIVSVNISHVEPDGLIEHFLTTVYFGALQPGGNPMISIFSLDE